MEKAPVPVSVVARKVYFYIEDYRNKNGMTTEEVCKKIGKKKQYLSRIKKPGVAMYTRTALSIAEKLSFDKEDFIEKTRADKQPPEDKSMGIQFMRAFPSPMIRASILENKEIITDFITKYERKFNGTIIK